MRLRHGHAFLCSKNPSFQMEEKCCVPHFCKKSRKYEEKMLLEEKNFWVAFFGTKRGGTHTYSGTGSSDGRIALVAGGQSSARMVPHLAKEAIVRERKRVGEIGWCVEQCSCTQF